MDGRKIIDIEKNDSAGRERCTSMGNLKDLMKRKREGGMSRGREEEGIFRRCKKRYGEIAGDREKGGKG